MTYNWNGKNLTRKQIPFLHYERQYNGVLNISCPPVSLSNCIRSNDGTHWISQSNFGMASEGPLSLSTVCNGSHGENHSRVILPTIQWVGFPRISVSLQESKPGCLLGHIKIQTRWFGQCLGSGEIPAFLKICWSS